MALYLANPGSATVRARVTKLGSGPAGSSESYEVPAGNTLRIDQFPEDRGSATYVYYFGGCIGNACVAFTDDGVAAEPCAADAARRWFLPMGRRRAGRDAYVIVANPFAVSAVMTSSSTRRMEPDPEFRWTTS